MTPTPRTSLSAKNRKIIWFAAVALLLAAAGGYVYSSKASPAPQSANTSSGQTEFVRRGDLAVTASGSGVLTAQTDANFGFETSGQVTAVYVKLGDQVEKGQVLAQLDDTLAQMEYEEAERALQELYSAASIAEVEQEIGTA
ncbi:MAG: biotin/lipoyl-binding protein, partial [Chloroflexota bacterium]